MTRVLEAPAASLKEPVPFAPDNMVCSCPASVLATTALSALSEICVSFHPTGRLGCAHQSFFPAVRRALAELGFIAVCFSILVVAGLSGFGIYRLATREGRMKAMTGNPFALPTAASDQTWNDDESETTLDLLGPALRCRYPWRH